MRLAQEKRSTEGDHESPSTYQKILEQANNSADNENDIDDGNEIMVIAVVVAAWTSVMPMKMTTMTCYM